MSAAPDTPSERKAAFDLTHALFELELSQFGAAACGEAGALLDGLVGALAGCGVQHMPYPRQVHEMNRVLFDDFGLRVRRKPKSQTFTLCGTLLGKGGSCLGLTTIYVCAAEALGLPIGPILFEGHTAVGHAGADPPWHIETLERGAILAPHRVAQMFGAPTEPEVLLPLGSFFAVHLSNQAAFVLAPAGRLDDALYVLDLAVELFPSYKAAWMNRSAVLVARGETDAARDSLRRALELKPGKRLRKPVGLLSHWLGEPFAGRGRGKRAVRARTDKTTRAESRPTPADRGADP